ALVEVDVRMHGVQPDAMAELTQPRQRRLALGRGEVVEDAARHQEVRRRDVALGLELGHAHGGVEHEVHVVPQEDLAGLWFVVEVHEAIRARRVKHARVRVEVPAHSTITSTSLAAASARSSASRFVSAIAITYPRRSPSSRTGLIV